jgi:hypothetical protein
MQSRALHPAPRACRDGNIAVVGVGHGAEADVGLNAVVDGRAFAPIAIAV